jgi:hypothetical protein
MSDLGIWALMKRMLKAPAVLVALLAAVLMTTALMTGVAAADPSVGSVAAALKGNPVYVDPAADSFKVDAARVKAALPDNTYLAVVAPSVARPGAEPDELPALISSQVGRGGTFIVLLGNRLYGSSTTVPGSLEDELATAQTALPAPGGDATGILVSLLQSLSVSADLHDPTGPARAGGPIGPTILVIGLVALVLGALVLWWWLRRKPTPRRPKRPQRPRDLVEIDASGEIIRRVPAAEREPNS